MIDATRAKRGAGSLSSAGRARALATVCAILFLTFVDNTIVTVVLADVQQDLAIGVVGLQWVVNGYMLTFAALMLAFGTLGDLFGRKRVMLAGVAMFCAGSAMCMLASSLAVLVAGRVVMGVGAAASEPGTLSMIRQVFPEQRSRAKALGVWAAVSGMALALGPVIGGLLVGFYGWRAVFAFGLAFGVISFVIGALTLPESANPAGRKLDIPGVALGAGALATVTVALIEGETAGYATWWIIALFAVAAVFGWLFVRTERRSSDPVLRPAFFRDRTLVGSVLVAFAINVGTFSIFFFTALYLQTIGGFSGYGIAAAFAGMCLAMVLAAIVTGRVVARHGPRWTTVLGCLATGGGIAALLAVLNPGVGALAVSWPLALGGMGVGMALVSVNAAVLHAVPGEQSGVAASTVNTAREVGGVVGVAVFGAVVNMQLTSSLKAQLKAIGVPPVFQQIVISGVTHGALQGGGGSQAQAAAAGGGERARMVHEVVQAAFRAFDAGLNTALLIAAVLLGLAAIAAVFLVRPVGDDTAHPA